MDDIQPTACELLEAMALLISENEQLRANGGNTSAVYGKREFTRDDLERGRQLAPMAFMSGAGTLVVKLDS